MSASKSLTHPYRHGKTRSSYQSSHTTHTRRFFHWLASWRKSESPCLEPGTGLEPGRERFAEDGYYVISTNQAEGDRHLEAQMVKLLITPTR